MAKKYFRDRHGTTDTLERLSEIIEFYGNFDADLHRIRIHTRAVSLQQRLEDVVEDFDRVHRLAMDLINEVRGEQS